MMQWLEAVGYIQVQGAGNWKRRGLPISICTGHEMGTLPSAPAQRGVGLMTIFPAALGPISVSGFREFPLLLTTYHSPVRPCPQTSQLSHPVSCHQYSPCPRIMGTSICLFFHPSGAQWALEWVGRMNTHPPYTRRFAAKYGTSQRQEESLREEGPQHLPAPFSGVIWSLLCCISWPCSYVPVVLGSLPLVGCCGNGRIAVSSGEASFTSDEWFQTNEHASPGPKVPSPPRWWAVLCQSPLHAPCIFLSSESSSISALPSPIISEMMVGINGLLGLESSWAHLFTPAPVFSLERSSSCASVEMINYFSVGCGNITPKI